jgi:hypothetical protein
MDLQPNQMMVFSPSIQYAVSATKESSFLLSHFNAVVESEKII